MYTKITQLLIRIKLGKKVFELKKILLVEDEYHIRQIITEYFATRNIEVIQAMNGYDALDKINETIDLVLLDIMMPGIDGYEVCMKMKQNYQTPIIFISALSEEENQLKAYELGADDYLTKPFKSSILYAKCQAVLKRFNKEENHLLSYGNIQIDTNHHVLFIQNKAITLAPKEYELLLYLCKYQGQVLSRELLIDRVWGYDYFGDGRAVDTYIKKLRKKLKPYDHYIQTIVKTGYMFKVVDL